MTSSSLYTDLPLPPHSGTGTPFIRLLTFSNGRWLLEVVPLVTSQYKALSYVWGDGYDTVPIQCNGIQIQVTRNLYWALQHLSIAFTGQHLWIDAICINQHDEAHEEKGQQIDIMGEIYSHAEEVLIWLSEPSLPANTDLCFEACKKYGKQWQYAKMLVALSYRGTWMELSDKTVQTSLALNNPFTEEIMAGLLEVLRHRYWTRVWVIQEMTLASKSRIITGRSSLDWVDFKIFLTMMEHCLPWWLRGMGPNFRALNDMTRMEQIGEPPASYGLSDLLVQFRWSSAKESRDKVYGLLGLLSQSQREYVLTDLGDKEAISTTECYTHVAFKLLQQSYDLSFLLQCRSPSFITRNRALPSWVPDWEYNVESLPPTCHGLTEGNPYHRRGDFRPAIYRGYNASASSECIRPFLRNNRLLVLRGMVVGKIATVCRPIEIHHQFLGEQTPKGLLQPWARASQQETLTRLSQIVWSNMVLTRSGIYRLGLLHFYNSIRKGAVMDIFLEYYELAQSNGTRLVGKDPLSVMFDVLTTGPRGREVLDPRFTDSEPAQDLVQEAAAEFRIQCRSIRWNPFLRLLRLVKFHRHFPVIYHLLLGLNYSSLGKIPSYLWVLITLNATMTFDLYIAVNIYVTVFVGYLVNTILSSVILAPYKLDIFSGTSLDHALARLDDGRLAQVPHDTKVGDEVALLSGGCCPFVVRRASGNRFELVGDCYVDGIMEGEGWQEDKVEEMQFI